MKKSLIAIAVGAVIAPMANANIVISEVVEGSSNNKAIEVANVGSSSVQLSGYSLFIESNGSGNWSNEYDLSDGLHWVQVRHMWLLTLKQLTIC